MDIMIGNYEEGESFYGYNSINLYELIPSLKEKMHGNKIK
jgi:hypothetical protein